MSEPRIHPTAIIDPAARLGADVEIGPFCTIGPNVQLGDRVRVISHASISGYTRVGEDCVIYPGVHLGHPPQDFKFQGEETHLILGKRNIVRENVTMHPGTAFDRSKTEIGDDCYFMVGSHVAHDCRIGDRVVFANGAAVGGSCTVEDHAILSGHSGVVQKSRVGRHAFIGAMAKINGDVIPYGSAVGQDARLVGLNVIGLKRRGIPRETIADLRAAYRLLFAREGTFSERVEDAARLYSENGPVMEIIAFIRSAGKRASLCMPDG